MRASIIIPLFNKVAYTRNCVQSLFANTTGGTYEIIFVDNGSKDETAGYLRTLDGPVKIVTHSNNLGFVKACNRGAKMATGQYLVFLNNDTEPQPGWLDSLMAAADTHPQAGAVGAKLVYPDGRLQEAGAIIFSDGSGYNFGRGGDPTRAAYNIPCEVDYCSGACLLVRRQIFESLGGFDERYSPAYYEETDLCFSLRKRGHCVIYNPASTVIHHESVTAASPESGGVKAYLQVNRRKFVAKWRSELQHQDDPPHISGKLPVTASRDRLRPHRPLFSSASATSPKQILVFYPHNPWPPRTGSHRRFLSMLRAFRRIGLTVHLVSSTAFTDRPWTSRSQERLRDEFQAECSIYHPHANDQALLRHRSSRGHQGKPLEYRLEGLDRLFKDKCRALNPDFVLVNYAHWGYLAYDLPGERSIKIIEMHDLVTLNEKMRKLALEQIGNPPFVSASAPIDENLFRRAALQADPSEFEVYDEYDLVLAISGEEAELTRPSLRKAAVETLPMAFEPVRVNNDYAGSPVFVISPNVFNFQGYLYLTGAILPRVRQRFADFHLEVIGDGCRCLSPAAGVYLQGYQPDLKPFYAQAPFAVCPLLGGTGQQVKIVEAMAHGVPVIAMRDVAESSPIVHGVNGLIAEDAESFARWMQSCLARRDLCRELGDKARDTIRAGFSERGLQLTLERLLNGAIERKSKRETRWVETAPKALAAKGPVDRILWIRTDAIGDNILAGAMLAPVKAKFPGAKITVFCQEHIKELYESNPSVASVLTYNRGRALSDPAYRSELAGKLEALQADLTLNSVYSREALTDFFALASKAREIIAFNGDLCNISLSERERTNQSYTRLIAPSKEAAPELDRHRQFLTALDIRDASLAPAVWLTDEDERAADRIFAGCGFDPQKTIGFFPGAQNTIRVYPFYARALSRFCRERRLEVMAFGTAAESAVSAGYLKQIGVAAIDLCGRTSLRQTAAVLKRCRMAVGAETGIAHMACAVGTPNVVVVGGGHFGRFMPYSGLSTLVCLPLECYGCNWRCQYSKPYCIQAVAPAVVEAALQAAWDAPACAPQLFVQHRGDWPAGVDRPRWQWPPPNDLPDDIQIHFVSPRQGVAEERVIESGPPANLLPVPDSKKIETIGRQRAELVRRLWQVQPADLPQLFGGDLGVCYRRLLAKDIKALPVSAEDWQVVRLLGADTVDHSPGNRKIKQLMVAMLFLYPHQLPFEVDVDAVPSWFREEYFRFLLSRPDCFFVPGETEQYHQHLEKIVAMLHRTLFARCEVGLWRQLAEIFVREADFIPVYFSGADLKSLYQKRAEIAEFVLGDKLGMLDFEFSPSGAADRKIRLGVYLSAIGPHSETYATLPVFAHLNRDEFEIHLYVHRKTDHPVEAAARNRVDKFQILPEAIKQSVQTVRADDLDILLFGSNLSANQGCAFMLACHRLARHQGIHFCNPVSSRLSRVDFFLLGEHTAPSGAASDQYSEAVVKLKGSGICFDLPTDKNVDIRASGRQDIGIDDGQCVFISGANFFKLIPELQRSWARIVAAVPESRLVLYPFGPAWSNRYPKAALVAGLAKALSEHGVESRRLVVVDTLKGRGDILGLLQAADIYLDAWPYNGATSLLDPLEVGLPTVVLAGEPLRFRQGAAILEELGLTEMVTRSEREYVDLAVGLSRDRHRSSVLSAKILARMQTRPPFLDPRRFADQLGDAFKRMHLKNTDKLRWAV